MCNPMETCLEMDALEYANPTVRKHVLDLCRTGLLEKGCHDLQSTMETLHDGRVRVTMTGSQGEGAEYLVKRLKLAQGAMAASIDLQKEQSHV